MKKFEEFGIILNTRLLNFYNYWMCFITAFDFLDGIPVGITSSSIRLKIYVISQ